MSIRCSPDPGRDTEPTDLAGWREAVIAGSAALFALSAPFSIAASQTAIFLMAVVAITRPRWALEPLRARPVLAGALVFYFLIQGLSILYSQHPLRSLFCLKGDIPVLFLPIFLAALQVPAARRLGLPLLLGAAGLSGLLGLAQHLSGRDPLGLADLEPFGARGAIAVGTLGGHLTYGGTVMLAFLAALALHLTTVGRMRIYWLACALASGAGLLASHARTAWIGAAVGVVTASAIALRYGSSRRRRALSLAPAGLMVLGAIVLLLLSPALRQRLFSLGQMEEEPRFLLWGTALRIAAAFPVFGAGLGSFPTQFPLFRIPGWYMATGHPHSDLLNALVHSGMAGVFAMLTLWYSAWRPGSAPAAAAPAGSAILRATLLTGFLTAGLGQCYFTDEEPAALLWFLLAASMTRGTGSYAPPRAGFPSPAVISYPDPRPPSPGATGSTPAERSAAGGRAGDRIE